MTEIGARAWACAEAMLGTPFRLQGRTAAYGLDCVGLVMAAYAEAGVRLSADDSYGLRGFPAGRAVAAVEAAGFVRVAERTRHGDVALFLLPGQQVHFALLAPGRLIHADAALRRIVAAPVDRFPAASARWRWIMKG